jgi:hypothetical protein
MLRIESAVVPAVAVIFPTRAVAVHVDVANPTFVDALANSLMIVAKPAPLVMACELLTAF